MIVPKLPVPDKKADEVQRGEGRKASNLMRDSFKNAGFSPSNYVGAVDGIQERTDIAGAQHHACAAGVRRDGQPGEPG